MRPSSSQEAGHGPRRSGRAHKPAADKVKHGYVLIGQEGGWEGASFLTALLQVNEVHLLAFGVQDVISHALMRQHRGTAAVRHEC